MRTVIDPQLSFGEQNIASLCLAPKSGDDIPHILQGLQFIYITPELRDRVFTILKEVLSEGAEGKASTATGRPGVEQWKILVLGVLRQGLNVDYDRVHELANQHNTLRLMLGHSGWDDDYQYNLQTLKDNLGNWGAGELGGGSSLAGELGVGSSLVTSTAAFLRVCGFLA